MPYDIGDKSSALYQGLSGFWQRFFRDTQDIEAFYQASEMYLGQAYLDLCNSVLSSGLIDTPVLSKEVWKLLTIRETELLFVEGASVAEDRYVYQMPADRRSVDVLQNTILIPDKTYEKDLDFEAPGDGNLAFVSDLFREEYAEEEDVYTPSNKIGWRYVEQRMGKSVTDISKTLDWETGPGAHRGDQLLIIGYRGRQTYPTTSGVATAGSVTVNPASDVVTFTDLTGDPTTPLLHAVPGDLVEVIASGSAYDGVYAIKEVVSAVAVIFEPAVNLPTTTSGADLKWRVYRGVYHRKPISKTIGAIRGNTVVMGDTSSWDDVSNAPLVYAVVRRQHVEQKVYGDPIAPVSKVTNLIESYLVPGTVKVYCTKESDPTKLVEEDVDYEVNYVDGTIKRLTDNWGAQSIHTCDYEFYNLIGFSASATAQDTDAFRVKQLALWAPEVFVDKKILADVYGSMIGRERVSTPEYKAFLRGIFSLYVYGPILKRVESAMNVSAGYPVIKTEGEVFFEYDNGIVASGVSGEVIETNSLFSTTEWTFSDEDVGGVIALTEVANDLNRGTFVIEEVVDENTVALRSSFGFVDETNVTWKLSRVNYQRVATSERNYKYPLDVPMREDLSVIENAGTLTFSAFDSLTDAFHVTDYLVDPYWWVNKSIPRSMFSTLFSDDVTEAEAAAQSVLRAIASPKLYSNIVSPVDGALVGDPGIYFGADSFGNLATNGVRHGVGYHIFDKFLKYHTFYIEIDPSVDLSTSFREDLEELILATKPLHTYPVVEPNTYKRGRVGLYEYFPGPIPKWTFGEGEQLRMGGDDLLFTEDGGLLVGDFFRYVDVSAGDTGVSGVIGVGDDFVLPVGTDQILISVRLNATAGGVPVIEGTDYWVDWRPLEATAWTVVPLTTWDNSVSNITYDATVVDRVNIDTTPIPDTTIGYTPLSVGGKNPAYVREGSLAPGMSPAEWSVVRTHLLSRPLVLYVDAGSGTPYDYF
jgi:hypothetical protein